MTFALSQIDLTSLEVVNNSYPELEVNVGYASTNGEDSISFSIEGVYSIGSSWSGRKLDFSYCIYMDDVFTAKDFVVEDDKVYIKNFKVSQRYEFSVSDLDTMDREYDEIHEFICEHIAGLSAKSNYTLTARLKQS